MRVTPPRFGRAALISALFLQGPPAYAVLQQTVPSDHPAAVPARSAGPRDAEVQIVARTGIVSVSMDDGMTWHRADVGTKVGPGAQFRTGSNSSVVCLIDSDQTFKLESYSKLIISRAKTNGTKHSTVIVLKFGALSAGFRPNEDDHSFLMQTPNTSLTIRGTVVRVVDQLPFPPTAESFTGRAVYRTLQRETRLGGNGYAKVSSVQGTAADTALSQSVVDPATARARSNSEARYVSDQVSKGATLSFDEKANIPVLRGGAGPTSDEALAASLPGRLSFALRWTGNTDLNFVVDNDIGDQLKIVSSGLKFAELLYPGFGLNTSSSGGLIPYDHRGGPNGGQEIAYWQGSFPTGVYGVGVQYVSGATADIKVNAFLDGKPLSIYTTDSDLNLFKVRTFRGTIGPKSFGGEGAAIVLVPNNPLFESFATDIDPDTQAVVAQALAFHTAQQARPAKGNSGQAAPVPAFATVTAKPASAKPAAVPAAVPAARAESRRDGQVPFAARPR